MWKSPASYELVSLITDQGVLEIPGNACPVMVPFSKAWDNSIIIQGVFHGLILERMIKDN